MKWSSPGYWDGPTEKPWRFWPHWSFDGFYKRYPTHLGGRALTMNEGCFPNFCIHWKGLRLDFIYVALAPGLRAHWHTKRRV